MRSTRPALAVAALLLALALAACGSSGSATARPADGAGAFPVTVQTKQGPQTVDQAPQRVVALDFPSADALLALGIVPVAMGRVSYVPGGIQAWTKEALAGRAPELLDVDAGIPLEKLAALRPDLIVASDTYDLDAVYAKLERLAPVITYRHGAGVDTWQQSTRLIGRAVGREPQARRIVADTEGRVARARRENPAFDGKTVTLFNYFQGTAYAINTPRDFSIRFLSTLGFELSPRVAQSKGQSGRLQVSSERLDLLDADVVLGTSSDSAKSLAALAHSPLFRRLPAVRRGSYASLGIGPATSIAFPSALSIRFALHELVPVLDRLARADGS